MRFGCVLVGPPGSGKTTACHGLQQFLTAIKRPCANINLDPANDALPYPTDVNICELITLDDVMTEFSLGPNGGLIYCMEYLENNLEWLKSKLDSLDDKFLIIDCPGQVELYTHHSSMRNILAWFEKNGFRICVVHMVDAHLCTDPFKYVAALILSLKTMIQLELPHLNVLSKIDLLPSYGKLAFNLDFFTEVQDLSHLLDRLESDRSFPKRLGKLNRALCELVEEFSLVGFLTLAVEEKESMLRLVRAIDKAIGYAFGSAGSTAEMVLESVAAVDSSYLRDLADIQERYDL
ncbi:GPN-loop GTPase [Zopfochytrium polystomum]|nr:GPN-loop GTPase [Zopfochytrium polystomum]